jgi:hypothetical protein
MGQHRREGLLDLTRLSPPTRRSLSLLLLIPLCALVTCVFRIFIGVETSGRFTPALLAIALVLTNWRLGLVAILVVIFLGLVTRDALEKLRLLVLPRLSVVLTLVVYCFALGGGLIEHFQWNRGPHMLLLPMVILTMIIERFYVAAQEEGGTVAARRLAGTGLVCVFCYLTLQWETAGRWLLAYPELHLVTVAAFILMGRYRGYQLAELWRFRDLASERDS